MFLSWALSTFCGVAFFIFTYKLKHLRTCTTDSVLFESVNLGVDIVSYTTGIFLYIKSKSNSLLPRMFG